MESKMQIKATDETVMTKPAIETLLMRESYGLKAIAPFFTRTTQQTIIEKIFGQLPF